ncbi:MAG TPA: tetraacyldisaccharide 4'-kinase [Mesorhizobium sp.]|jgi:tetraacyldisaccharide 4'-kinase|nr:tetraacyldisaccharide 4'-kinase [Mesorhizobium sp.]
MNGRAPPFWWAEGAWQAQALAPLAALYGVVARRRMDRAPRVAVGAPVICVGNFTLGGSGKTPAAIALAHAAKRMGLKPGFLSRGHGRRTRDLRLVEVGDDARSVGDEPLLLAAHAPTAVAADRAAGAATLIEKGCDLLIMDDGFQSARIAIDYALIVVDGDRGMGNARVFPAGPLRAPLAAQMAHADALLVLKGGRAPAKGAELAVRTAARAGRPVFGASLKPVNRRTIAGRRLLAFAGIGNPQKFFAGLEAAGGSVVERRAFGDHHDYASAELAALAAQADGEGLVLVTTAKDRARLEGLAEPAFLEKLLVFEVAARFEPPQAPQRIIEAARAAWRRRVL